MQYSLILSCIALAVISPCLGQDLPPSALARLGSTAFRFADSQLLLGFSPEGKRFYTSSWSRHELLHWDMTTGQITKHIALEDGKEQPVALSSDAKLFATSGQNRKVFVRNVEDGHAVLTINDHPPVDRGFVIAFSPDNKLLAVSDEWGGMRLYEIAAGKQLKGPSSDGKRVNLPLQDVQITGLHFSADSKRLVVCKRKETPLVWDLKSEKVVVPAVVNEKEAVDVAIAGKDSELIVITNDRQKWYSESHTDKDGSVHGGSWGSFHGTVRVYHLDSLKVLKTIEIPYSVESAAVSNDGRHLAVLGRDGSRHGQGAKLGLWSLSSGKSLGEIDYGDQRAMMSFVSDGSMLIVSGISAFRRFSITQQPGNNDSLKEVEESPSGTDAISSLIFTPDSMQLLATGAEGITIWDVSKKNTRQRIRSEDHYSGNVVALEPTGNGLWLGKGPLATHWECAGGEWKRNALSIAGYWYFQTLAISPDGNHIATGMRKSEGFTIKGPFPKTFSVYDKSAKPININAATEKAFERSDILHLAHSPDGAALCMATGERYNDVQHLVLLDVKAGYRITKKFSFSLGPISSFAYSPNGKLIAIAGGDTEDSIWRKRKSGVELWRPDSEQTPIKLIGQQGRVRSVVFSHDGTFLVTGGEDGAVRLWDTTTGKELKKVGGHNGAVTAVTFSPDGKILATGSDDTTILLWEWEQLRK